MKNQVQLHSTEKPFSKMNKTNENIVSAIVSTLENSSRLINLPVNSGSKPKRLDLVIEEGSRFDGIDYGMELVLEEVDFIVGSCCPKAPLATKQPTKHFRVYYPFKKLCKAQASPKNNTKKTKQSSKRITLASKAKIEQSPTRLKSASEKKLKPQHKKSKLSIYYDTKKTYFNKPLLFNSAPSLGLEKHRYIIQKIDSILHRKANK